MEQVLREISKFPEILGKLSMRKQCVPGSFLPAHAREPGNEANDGAMRNPATLKVSAYTEPGLHLEQIVNRVNVNPFGPIFQKYCACALTKSHEVASSQGSCVFESVTSIKTLETFQEKFSTCELYQRT